MSHSSSRPDSIRNFKKKCRNANVTYISFKQRILRTCFLFLFRLHWEENKAIFKCQKWSLIPMKDCWIPSLKVSKKHDFYLQKNILFLIGKDRLPSIIFQGRAVKLPGGHIPKLKNWWLIEIPKKSWVEKKNTAVIPHLYNPGWRYDHLLTWISI